MISILSSLITVADSPCGMPGMTVVGRGGFVGAEVGTIVGVGATEGSGVTAVSYTHLLRMAITS